MTVLEQLPQQARVGIIRSQPHRRLGEQKNTLFRREAPDKHKIAAGILFGLITAAIAGFALVSDFDAALTHAQDTYPAYMEWFAALGLVLTMVWLYVEAIWITRSGRAK